MERRMAGVMVFSSVIIIWDGFGIGVTDAIIVMLETFMLQK